MIAFLLMLSTTTVQGAFSTVEKEDPITQKRALHYELASGRSAKLSIGCDSIGSGDLFVRLTPRFYTGGDLDEAVLGATVDYRFGGEKKKKSYWRYTDKGLEVSDPFFPEKRKARFIDALARNNEVHVRYVLNREKETVSFRYALSVDELGRVVRACNPRLLQRTLRQLASPIVSGS